MRNRTRHQGGFTLIETLIAIVVLAVGMLGVAALISKMDFTTHKSRYMSVAALLATEKLEQLNRYPLKDDNIRVSSGTTAGSLTDDTSSGDVNYFDEVLVSSGNGSISETTSGTDGSGNVLYTTIAQSPDGGIVTNTGSAPPNDAGTLTFNRRWLIEKDVPVAGVCRITVLVRLKDVPSETATMFQMSMVRQYAN
jgi:prepilin-type N-terminal cleavage/methylation domain-containing protein